MVGIDIEKFQSIDLDIYNYILNENDKERIAISTDKSSSFFSIWSAKEAILKAHGCGLVNDLDRLQINGETGIFCNTTYYLKKLDIHPSYSSIVSSSTPVENVVIKETFIDNCVGMLNHK
jgi:4'-phosphopantetheinyl transferase